MRASSTVVTAQPHENLERPWLSRPGVGATNLSCSCRAGACACREICLALHQLHLRIIYLHPMDIASTVYTLTVGIIQFVAEHGDKDALKEQISTIAIQIQSIITPLRLRDIPSAPLRNVLEALQTVLRNVEEHLRSWNESRSRRLLALVNPWAVTAELKEDREQMMHQYIMLMGAMQVVEFIRGYTVNLPLVGPGIGGAPSRGIEIESNEVLKFWRRHIGNDVSISRHHRKSVH